MSCERATLSVPNDVSLTERALDYAHLKQCPECRHEGERLRGQPAVAITATHGVDLARPLRQGIDWTIATISPPASTVVTKLTKIRVPRPPALPVAAVARGAMSRVSTAPDHVRVLAARLARPVAHGALALGRGAGAAATGGARLVATLGLAVAGGVAAAAQVLAAVARAGVRGLGHALVGIGCALAHVGSAGLVIGRAAWRGLAAAARIGLRLAAEAGEGLLALGVTVARAGAMAGRATGRALLGGGMAILAGLGWIGLATVATGRAAARVLAAGVRGAAGVLTSAVAVGATLGLKGGRAVTAGGIALGQSLAVWIGRVGQGLQALWLHAGEGLARLGEVFVGAAGVLASVAAVGATFGLKGGRAVTAGGIALGHHVAIWVPRLGQGLKALSHLAGEGLARLGEVLASALRVAARAGAAAARVAVVAFAVLVRAGRSLGAAVVAASGRGAGQVVVVSRAAASRAALPGHVARVEPVARALARRTTTGAAWGARAVGGSLPLLKPVIAVAGLAVLVWALAAGWPPRGAEMVLPAPSPASVEPVLARRPVTPDPDMFTASPPTASPAIGEPAPTPPPAPAPAAMRSTLPEPRAEAPAPPRRRAEAVPAPVWTRRTVAETSDAEDASAGVDWLLKGGGSRRRAESP